MFTSKPLIFCGAVAKLRRILFNLVGNSLEEKTERGIPLLQRKCCVGLKNRACSPLSLFSSLFLGAHRCKIEFVLEVFLLCGVPCHAGLHH